MIKVTGGNNFNTVIERVAKKLNVAPETVAKLAAFKLYKGITKRTPVDTGRARGGWLINPDVVDPSAPEKGEIWPVKRSPPGGSDPVWFVTNAVPYIPILELGRSNQSGKGYMIQRTLTEVKRELAKELEEAFK